MSVLQDVTKVHSTPHQSRTYELLRSPSLSSISTAASTVGSLVSDESIPGIIKCDVIYKIQKKGKVWKYIKPQHAGRLYAQIVSTANDDIHQIAKEHSFKMIRSEKKAIQGLYQLVLDVSDYQMYQLPDISDESINFNDILAQLENDEPQHMQESTDEFYYLAACKNELQKAIFGKIVRFFAEVLQYVHANVRKAMYFEKFMKYLEILSKSKYLVIRHTAVLIAMKMLTVVLLMTRTSLDKNISTCYENILLTIFDENCSINCNKLKLMRIQCMAESFIWTIHFPRYMEICCKHLMLATNDDQENIICAFALKTIRQLMQEVNCNSLLSLIIKKIEPCLQDDHYKIRKLALEISNKAIIRYNYKFSTKTKKLFSRLIYNKDALVGRAACIVYYNALTKDNVDEDYVFQDIVALNQNNPEMVPCFVESAHETFTLLDNIEWMLKQFLNIKRPQNEELILILIFQCAIQKITGKSSLRRDHPQDRVSREEDSLDILKIFMKYIKHILNKHTFKILEALRELLVAVQPQESIASTFEDGFKMLHEIFNIAKDADTLEVLCKILFVDYRKENEAFLSEWIEMFESSNNLCFEIPSFAADLYTNLVTVNKKFASVTQAVDVTDRLQWSLLFELLKLHLNQSDDYTLSIVTCVCNHLVWKSKRIESDDIKEIQIAGRNVLEFIELSFQIVNAHQSLNLNILDRLMAMIIDLKVDLLKGYFTNEQQYSLYECITQHLFESARQSMPLRKRQSILGKYLHLIANGKINSNYLLIYKYFVKFQADYGTYFKTYLNLFNPITIVVWILTQYTDNESEFITEQIDGYIRFLSEPVCSNLLQELIKNQKTHYLLKYCGPIVRKLRKHHGSEMKKFVNKNINKLENQSIFLRLFDIKINAASKDD